MASSVLIDSNSTTRPPLASMLRMSCELPKGPADTRAAATTSGTARAARRSCRMRSSGSGPQLSRAPGASICTDQTSS
jgi:hypothetical protein